MIATRIHAIRPRHGRVLGIVVTLALAVATSRCTPSSEEGTPDASEPPSSPGPAGLVLSAEQVKHGAVRWNAVQATSMTQVTEVPAHLVPNEDQTAHLGAPTRGRVIAVHVRIGDRVVRGQPLVTLQSQDAAAARAEHTQAVAELTARQMAATYARVARDRADRLLELKAMSRQDVERAHTDDQLAAAARAHAEADVERARANLTQLGVDIETGAIVLRTPLAGVVLSRDAVPGSVVEAGTSLVTVSDVGTLWLDIAATEGLAAALRPGARVRFTVPAFPSETFEAAIQNVGAALNPATRTLPVRAIVRNTSAKLLPEMFATVSVEQGEARPGIALTGGAIQLLDQRPVVFVAHPDSQGGARFERRDVEIGARTQEQVHIVHGLAPGDLVVTEGAFTVKSEFARVQGPAGS